MRIADAVECMKHYLQAGLVPMLEGPPGGAKSAVSELVAGSLSWDFLPVITSIMEPVDVVGLPVPGGDEVKEARFKPFGVFSQIYSASKPTLVLIDDLGQATHATQASVMQLIHGGRLNGHVVSKHVRFAIATNRAGDRAGVNRLLSAVRNRVVQIHMEPTLDDFVAWGLGHGVSTLVLAFLRFRPDALYEFDPSKGDADKPFPSLRSWDFLSRAINAGFDFSKPYGVEAASGFVGEARGAEFAGFVRIFNQLPNPDAVLMSPDTAEVPKDMATLCALCGALARKATDNNGDRIFRYAARVPADVSVWFVGDVLRVCPTLINSRAYIGWATKHGSKVS